MIYLKKGQVLADNPGMVVYDQTGYYNDGDSIICSAVTTPDEPACRFEAKYVAYGGLVYSVSDPDKLLEEIIKMDPNSLYGKDSKQIAVDKMVENIVPQKSQDLTAEIVKPATIEEATTTPQVVPQAVTPPVSTTESTTTPATITPIIDTSTTTPTTITPIIDTSTTTPSTTTPIIDISTTTPEISSTPVDTSTTTDPVAPVVDTSTTTPEIMPVPADNPPVEPTSTSSEVVAFAKNLVKSKISKELGL